MVLGAGVSFFAVLVLLPIFFRPEILTAYYRVRFRSRPELLLQALLAPEGSDPERFPERYLRSDEGTSAILDLLLDSFGNQFESMLTRSLEAQLLANENLQPLRGTLELGCRFRESLNQASWRPVNSFSVPSSPSREKEKLQACFNRLAEREIRSTRFPSWVFTVGRPDGGWTKVLARRAPAAPSRLGSALRSPRPEIRLEAALDLCVLGPRAAPALADLVAALGKESSPEVRGALLEALSSIGSALLPALLDLSQTKDRRAVDIVERFCFLLRCESLPRNLWSPALPDLRELALSGEPFVKDWASRLEGALERGPLR